MLVRFWTKDNNSRHDATTKKQRGGFGGPRGEWQSELTKFEWTDLVGHEWSAQPHDLICNNHVITTILCIFDHIQAFCSNFPSHEFSWQSLSASPFLTPPLRRLARHVIERLDGNGVVSSSGAGAVFSSDVGAVSSSVGAVSSSDVGAVSYFDVGAVSSIDFSKIDHPPTQTNIVEGLTLMLPLIESVMRIRFAVANGCPNRLLTAECEGEGQADK